MFLLDLLTWLKRAASIILVYTSSNISNYICIDISFFKYFTKEKGNLQKKKKNNTYTFIKSSHYTQYQNNINIVPT